MTDPFKLTYEQFQEVLAIVRPVLGNTTERERQAHLIRAFGPGHPLTEIDCSGNGDTFTILLINRVQQFGHFKPNEEALWTLLRSLQADLGVNWQNRIDTLAKNIYPGLPDTVDGSDSSKTADLDVGYLLQEVARLRIEVEELRTWVLERLPLDANEEIVVLNRNYSLPGGVANDE